MFRRWTALAVFMGVHVRQRGAIVPFDVLRRHTLYAIKLRNCWQIRFDSVHTAGTRLSAHKRSKNHAPHTPTVLYIRRAGN